MIHVMKFGIRSLLEHAEEASAEMGAAHRYYNNLMRLKLDERAAFREIRSRFAPGLNEAEADMARITGEIDAVYEEISMARRDASKPASRDTDAKPSKIAATAEQRTRLETLREERKKAAESAKVLRAEFSALTAAAHEEFDARASGAPKQLLEQIREIGRQLKEAKRKRNNPDVPQLKRSLDTLKDQKKKNAPQTAKKAAANARVFDEMMGENWPEAWKLTKSLERATHAAALKLRAESGLTHGTYVATELAIEQAFETSDEDPRFRRWDGGRKIGRQISGEPLTGLALYGGEDGRLQIVERQPLRGRKDPALRIERSATSAKNHAEYAIVRVPIGKGEGKRWLSAEVFLHRPIPADARILWVYVVPRKHGERMRYTLQLTVETERPLVEREHGEGECSIKLRWSREPLTSGDAAHRGIIVADVDGKPFALDGTEYQQTATKFAVRGGAYQGMLTARSLRSVTDMYFEGGHEHPERGSKTQLVAWLKEHMDIAPAWLLEMTSAKDATETERARGALWQWRDHARLARVATAWIESLPWLQGPPLDPSPRPGRSVRGRSARTRLQELWVDWKHYCDGKNWDYHADKRSDVSEWLETQGVTDECAKMAIWLEWWRRKDLHLSDMARNIDQRARLNRKNQYRVMAAKLARQFGSVAVHELDLAKVAKRKTKDRDENEDLRQVRYQRVCAAPAEFKEALKLAFGAERYREIKRERDGDALVIGGARKTDLGAENKEVVVEEHHAAE